MMTRSISKCNRFICHINSLVMNQQVPWDTNDVFIPLLFQEEKYKYHIYESIQTTEIAIELTWKLMANILLTQL